MQIHRTTMKRIGQLAGALVLSALAGLSGCKLDSDTNLPTRRGPAELAISFELFARPDLVNADGASTSAVSVIVRDRDGQPLPDRLVYFVLFGSGELSNSFGTTDGAGVAVTTYRAPVGGPEIVTITARTVDADASGQIYRSVSIELRAPIP
jgi:hypothetical protein